MGSSFALRPPLSKFNPSSTSATQAGALQFLETAYLTPYMVSSISDYRQYFQSQ
jgi:hypothetical protein